MLPCRHVGNFWKYLQTCLSLEYRNLEAFLLLWLRSWFHRKALGHMGLYEDFLFVCLLCFILFCLFVGFFSVWSTMQNMKLGNFCTQNGFYFPCALWLSVFNIKAINDKGLSSCAWLLKVFIRHVRCLMMWSLLGHLFSSPLKVNRKDGKTFVLCSDCHSQGLWQADSAELSQKKYIEMIGQQHALYKYNPASPDSWWLSWRISHERHQAWWPCFSWLGGKSLADLNWQSCIVVSCSPKLSEKS